MAALVLVSLICVSFVYQLTDNATSESNFVAQIQVPDRESFDHFAHVNPTFFSIKNDTSEIFLNISYIRALEDQKDGCLIAYSPQYNSINHLLLEGVSCTALLTK